VYALGYERAKPKAVVTSATGGVTRPPSRELILIRHDKRVLRDGRAEVGFSVRVD
jgi:hypothetical protein